MKFDKLLNGWKKIEKFAEINKPQILTGCALAGLVVTIIQTYRAAPIADRILKEKRKDLIDVRPDDREAKRVVVKETIKELAPVVLPTIVMATATAACIIGSNRVSSKRIAVLSAAYSLSETAIKDLNTKMNDILGEKKTKTIKEAIAKDKLKKDGDEPKESEVFITGDGDVLCKDLYSGRYFRSNAQKIGQAINHLSHDILQEMYVSLNDLYDLIGLPMIPLGEDLGWNVDDLMKGSLPITLSAQLTDSGLPCLCLDYDISVRADYRNLH